MTKKQLIDALNKLPWLSDDTPVVVTYIGDDAQPGTDMYKANLLVHPIVEVDGRDGSETTEFEIYIEGFHETAPNVKPLNSNT